MKARIVKNQPLDVPFQLSLKGYKFFDLSEHIGEEYEVLDKDKYPEGIVIDMNGERKVIFNGEYEFVSE